MNAPDYYSILGIPRDAKPDEIRKAYFSAARRLHPDLNVSPGDTEYFIGAKEAYEVLSDAKKRAIYDSGLTPEITINLHVSEKITYSRESLLDIPEPQLVYALLEYSPNNEDPDDIPSTPLNICLAIDRSTSMKGINLDIVKTTAIQLIRRLRSQDIFSLVVFSDRAEVMIPSSRMGDLSKYEARIQMLQASGGTELYNGLVAAYSEIKRSYDPSHINHIILLTDGRTYGDEKYCLELADEAMNQKIGITGLGIGHEWNDTFIDELARRTGGSSIYISNPQDIQSLLLNKFDKLWQIYADNITIEFKEKENVKLRYAFRLKPELGLMALESPINLGPLLRSGSLSILLEFLVTSIDNANVIELFDGQVNVSILTQTMPVSKSSIRLMRPVSNAPTPPAPPPIEIIQALSHLTLYRLQEQARLEVAAGEYDQASLHLKRLATHVLQQGNNNLARTILLEAESLKEKQSYSLEGEKRIKYGTRALLLPRQGEHQI